MDTRPSWDEYFLHLADKVAMRSTCLRRSVGAIIVRDKQIVSTGYNGSPPGMAHCTDPGVGCLLEFDDKDPSGRCIRTLHAEQNAILQAAQHGVSTKGAALYVTCASCHICARMIAGAGIERVIFRGDPIVGWAWEVLNGSGIVVSRFLTKEEQGVV